MILHANCGQALDTLSMIIGDTEQCDVTLAECLQAEYSLTVDQQQLFHKYNDTPILLGNQNNAFSKLL